ncbi:MAG TPA: efflux RND transporter periplasmic adaptor subunit [Gemmataceae bacterium]
MKVSSIPAVALALISLSLPACHLRTEGKEQSHEEDHKIVVTSPQAKDVIITQPYVCLIRSRRHIDVRALVDGYLKEISVKEGQTVKQGEVMFEILPTLYQAKYDAEFAEAKLAEIELINTKRLFAQRIVSDQDVALHEAKLAKAKANMGKAWAELNWTKVTAPFNGIVDRLQEREGSLIKERDILTTLSDNGVMWVYFNVPEARYLEYMKEMSQGKEIGQIELKLANGNIFHYPSMGVTIEAKFNNETGNIKFRADFENPHGLLRHGQTGTVLIHRTLNNAIVIPQRATFELLDKLYVYVVGEDDVVHRRLITIQREPGLEDIFIIKSGLDVKDKIVLEGVREVHDGGKVEYEFRKPEEALANQKNPAE